MNPFYSFLWYYVHYRVPSGGQERCGANRNAFGGFSHSIIGSRQSATGLSCFSTGLNL